VKTHLGVTVEIGRMVEW